MEAKKPSIVDLNAELAKLTMFRRAPQSTAADRKESVADLASYRDGLLLAIKASGRDHWERHLTGDELVYIIDGSATLEIVCDDGPPQSYPLRAGMIAVIPQGAWHRLLSSEGATQMAVTPFPPVKVSNSMSTIPGKQGESRCERSPSTPSSTPAATALCGTWRRIRTRSSGQSSARGAAQENQVARARAALHWKAGIGFRKD